MLLHIGLWCSDWFKFIFLFGNALITPFELEGEFCSSVALRIVFMWLDFILSTWKVTGLWNKSHTQSSHLTFKASELICKFRPCMVLLLVSTNTALMINALHCLTEQMQWNPVTWLPSWKAIHKIAWVSYFFPTLDNILI